TVQIREVRRGRPGKLIGYLEAVAIPPYRSGKFQGSARPFGSTGGCSSRNPTVLIREVPTEFKHEDNTEFRVKSQSHRTDQGGSSLHRPNGPGDPSPRLRPKADALGQQPTA